MIGSSLIICSKVFVLTEKGLDLILYDEALQGVKVSKGTLTVQSRGCPSSFVVLSITNCYIETKKQEQRTTEYLTTEFLLSPQVAFGVKK